MARDTVLEGRRVLVVEDDGFAASFLCERLAELGCVPIGPAGSVEAALAYIDADVPDAAMLDVDVAGSAVFPVADSLADRGVPFLLASGYDAWMLPAPYRSAPMCVKPIRVVDLVAELKRMLAMHASSS